MALNTSLVEINANKLPKPSSRGFQLIIFFEDFSFWLNYNDVSYMVIAWKF